MKNEILTNIDYPEKLEKLYRSNNEEFKKSFNDVYTEIRDNPLVRFWKLRLDENDIAADEISPGTDDTSKGNNKGLIYTIAAVFVCGTILKIPQVFGLDMQNFLTSNLPSIIFPALAVYYLLKYRQESKKYVIILSSAAIISLFMNLLPWSRLTDTHLLSSFHFSFITWILLGAAYVNFDIFSSTARMQFIRRNGDMFILTGVLLCAGMVLIMLTVAMFKVIQVKLDYILENYVVIYGLVAAPFAANYMIESSPKIINRVAPFISKLFTPLMLVVMTGFLVSLVFYAKDPFNNREELIVFNVLLAAIIAVIVFSFSAGSGSSKTYNRILVLLSVEGLIVNSIALAGIIYRLVTFGVSPNRIAVIGANLLLFINLIIIALNLLKYLRSKTASDKVENSMTLMLPYYAVWAIIIAVIIPFVFGFK